VRAIVRCEQLFGASNKGRAINLPGFGIGFAILNRMPGDDQVSPFYTFFSCHVSQVTARLPRSGHALRANSILGNILSFTLAGIFVVRRMRSSGLAISLSVKSESLKLFGGRLMSRKISTTS